MKKYLNILIDAINKKSNLLDQIMNIVDEQETCVAKSDFSLAYYNELMEKKGELIADIDKLDDGFTAVYARISPELKQSQIDYTDELRVLQGKVSEVSEKTTLIQAKEIRVHNTLERMLKASHPQVNYSIGKSEAALKYYKTMNKTTVAPGSIFVDTKKKK